MDVARRRAGVAALCLVLGPALALVVWRSRRAAGPTVQLVEREVAAEELLYPDRRWIRNFPGSTLDRFVLSEAEVRRVVPQLAHPWNVYEPSAWFAYRPGLDVEVEFPEHPAGRYRVRTNSLGMRRDGEPAAVAPDLRVLVAGDSHADGVCSNEEGFAAVAEARLRALRPGRTVEVLNASRGGQSPYGYLGTLERFVDLEPDVFVLWFSASNDFVDPLFLGKAFRGEPMQGLPRELEERRRSALEAAPAVCSAGLNAAFYLMHRPEDADLALELCEDILREVSLIAAREGMDVLVLHLPAPVFLPWKDPVPQVEQVTRRLGVELPVLAEVAAALERRLTAVCEELELAHLDLRPLLEPEVDRAFYRSDLHLNLHGQRLVGQALAAELERRVR